MYVLRNKHIELNLQMLDSCLLSYSDCDLAILMHLILKPIPDQQSTKQHQNRTEQNISLFRHSAYIAHSPNTNSAWKKKRKGKKHIKSILRYIQTCENINFNGEKTHLTLNRHTSRSTIIKDINIYEFLNAKALIQ